MRKSLLLGVCAAAVLALLNPPARAVDPASVQKAVDAGAAYLKSTINQDGSWGMGGINNGNNNDIGATALVALTLLECDVPPGDPVLKKAADYMRAAAVTDKSTYNISLLILFLDKLRDPVDVALIESLTVRLLAGQNPQGGWGYLCPQIPEEEVKRLSGLVKDRVELKAGTTLPKGGGDTKRTPQELPNEIKTQLMLINRGGAAGGGGGPIGPLVPGGAGNEVAGGGAGDNSNTQFATLALWVARRHGLPVDVALGRVAVRFRKSVNADGAWGYLMQVLPGGNNSTAPMTCAGLLALAVSYGVSGEQHEERTLKALPKDKLSEKDKDAEGKPRVPAGPDISKDVVITRALTSLATAIGQPTEKLKAAGKPAAVPQIGGQSFYFLWSLERVCMALDLDTVGGKDWYEWGAEILLANQKGDGSWEGEYANYRADTCFAILFLKRANFARDLSAHLKGKLEKREVRGGVGGEGLKEKIGSGEKLGGGVTKPGEGVPDKPVDPKVSPKPVVENRAGEQMAREALDAKGERQEKLLTDLRDGKGRQYTEALVVAVNRLDGDAKKSARKLLAERFAKDSATQLTDYLDDRDVEVRRAAVLACALAESKTHVPQLIGLLRDREPLVARAAWAALKNMTNQNFGPTADATDADKDKAIDTWREWWKKNGK